MRFDAIVFDFGNTLVPWGARESRVLYEAVDAAFTEVCGPTPDFHRRASEARDHLIRAREDTSMREVTIDEWASHILAGDVPDALPARVEEAMARTLVAMCRVPEGIRALLERLGRNRPLAVLSNFVLTQPIEDVLKRAGLWDLFVHVEVSATTGYAKPHPLLFEIVREKLGTPMERTLMVGDEFWADIVGGHRAGLLTALTHEHRRGPTRDARTPDIAADRILGRLDELD